MKVPAWKQPLSLFARMHGAGGLFARAGCIVSLGQRLADHLVHRMPKVRKAVRHVLDLLCNQVNDDAFALQIPCNAKQTPVHNDAAKLGIDLGPNDDIGHPSFIL